MGLGRFLNKRVLFGHALANDGNEESPAILLDGGKVISIGSHNVEGDVTATGAVVNSLQIKGGASVTAAWRTIYTWNIPAVPGIVGSTNAVVSQDVAMSGAAIGDAILVAPIGSMAVDLHVQGFCYSAANVNLRAWYTGSTGAYTPGNVPFKIVALKL